MKQLLISGTGDFARELTDTILDNKLYDLKGFISNNKFSYRNIETIMTDNEFVNSTEYSFILGIGSAQLRYKLYKLYEKQSSVRSIDKSVRLLNSYTIELGSGVVIQPGTILTNSIVIEDNVLINLNCTVGHNCQIGHSSILSPGVNINGHTKIGQRCEIGSNVCSVPGTVVGDDCIVGAGTVLKGIYPSNSLIVGVPGIVKKTLEIKQ